MQQELNPNDDWTQDEVELRCLLATARHIAQRWKICGSDADDFAQQGMQELLAYHRAGHSIGNRLAVLRKIVTRKLVMAKRRERPVSELPPELQAISLSPYEWVARDEQRKNLCLAAHLLPMNDRRVLEPIEHSFSYRHLAETVGCSESSLDRQKKDVLARLALYMARPKRMTLAHFHETGGYEAVEAFCHQEGLEPISFFGVPIGQDSIGLSLPALNCQSLRLVVTCVLRPFNALTSELSWIVRTQDWNIPFDHDMFIYDLMAGGRPTQNGRSLADWFR